MISLAGKTALVTGAGRRVGAAIATRLGAEGMHVLIAYHQSREGAQGVAEAVRVAGGRATTLQGDLQTPEGARQLADRALGVAGGLDVLVPSAANFENVPLDDIDDGHWERALGLNLRAPAELALRCRASLAARAGSLVFITGYCTRAPYAGYLPYVVSKGALSQLTRALSVELAPDVRVNAVAPGTVLPPPDHTETQIASLITDIPLARVGTAQDVAEAVVYFATAPYVTGQELFVDGGRTV